MIEYDNYNDSVSLTILEFELALKDSQMKRRHFLNVEQWFEMKISEWKQFEDLKLKERSESKNFELKEWTERIIKSTNEKFADWTVNWTK